MTVVFECENDAIFAVKIETREKNTWEMQSLFKL